MLFKRRKLATKTRAIHYGRSPSYNSVVTRSRNKNFLKTIGPTSFHTRTNRKPVLQVLRAKLSPNILKFTKLIIIPIVVVFGIYSVFFSSYFSVTTIKVESTNDNQTIIGGDIISDLKDYKGKNLLFVDKPEIQKIIQDKYPEIDDVQISTNLPDTIVVSFSEFPPSANITNISPESTKKYIVNSVGYVTKTDADDPQLPYLTIKTEALINTEGPIIDKEKLAYITGAIKYYTDKFGMKIIETEYKPIPREVYLRTEKFFYIWLDIQKPYEDQLQKLKKALVKIDIYNQPLQYIDLRITGESGEKIIYKKRK